MAVLPPATATMPSTPTLPLDFDDPARRELSLETGAVLLGGFACAVAGELLEVVSAVEAEAPFRTMVTPGGRTMSVAMTNCGDLGWVSDRRGYRYDACDPESGRRWPPMPDLFADLATRAAATAGYDGHRADVCLVNRYEPGTRLSLHQDRDEQDLRAPIVSVSLGVPAVFLWGGLTRAVRPRRLALYHGDVVVWGGPARLVHHGVQPLAEDRHPLTGSLRYNLTFRRAA